MNNKTRYLIGRVFMRNVKTPFGYWKERLDTEPQTISTTLKHNK